MDKRGQDFPAWFNSIVKPQKEDVKPVENPAGSSEPEQLLEIEETDINHYFEETEEIGA